MCLLLDTLKTLDATRARRVLQGVLPKYEAVDGLSWTPDEHLLYTAYVADALVIWEMNADGSNRRQLTSNVSDHVDRQVSVTADNRYIIFQSNRSGSLQIWRTNRDGSDPKQLTGGGNKSQPSLSPDSRWIVYVSDRSGESILSRIPIDGGAPTEITHRYSWNPQVSPDGKHIAFLESSNSPPGFELAITSFEGGKTEKTFALPPRMPVNLARQMRWTPDGGVLIYRDSLQGLWRQRLDDEKPQPIKGFENVLTSQFAWSFNGKNLAFTRKSDMQEILLLQNSR